MGTGTRWLADDMLYVVDDAVFGVNEVLETFCIGRPEEIAAALQGGDIEVGLGKRLERAGVVREVRPNPKTTKRPAGQGAGLHLSQSGNTALRRSRDSRFLRHSSNVT